MIVYNPASNIYKAAANQCLDGIRHKI
jgi:hypothetical protein